MLFGRSLEEGNYGSYFQRLCLTVMQKLKIYAIRKEFYTMWLGLYAYTDCVIVLLFCAVWQVVDMLY